VKIDGWDVVRGMAGVQDARQLLCDGTQLRGLLDSFSRLGYVRVQGDHSEDAITRAGDAVAMLTVRLGA
jgi:L-amino acid ligase C-terminal domain 2